MSDLHVRPPNRRRPLLTLVALGTLVLSAALTPTLSASAQPSQADVPTKGPIVPFSGWGFAYNDQPTPPVYVDVDYVMPKHRQWGTWKAAHPDEWATVSRTTAGVYRVRFPWLTGKGVAHVTAVDSGPVWCQIAGTAPAFDAQYVTVRCHTPGGRPADSRFAVSFTDSRAVEGHFGWVSISPTGLVQNSFNSSGGVNAASFGGGGSYKVWLPGLGGAEAAGNVQVTAVNPRVGARCKVAGWLPGATGQVIYVNCYDAVGVPAASEFALTYHHKANLFGYRSTPKLWGYFQSGGAPGTNVNSQGGVNYATPVGTGLEMVTFPKLGIDQSHVQVTAYGRDASFCNLVAPWQVFGGDAYVKAVACYDAAGALTYPVAFTSYTSRY